MGGPLIALRVSARGAWQGCVEEGQVNGDGDVPDDAELLADARTVLTDPATGWEDCGAWETDGPAVLMDSVTAGADLDVEHPTAEHSPNRHPPRFGPIPSGRWSVRAVRAPADEHARVGLLQLLPAPSPPTSESRAFGDRPTEGPPAS